jgi:hypothetical protein
MLPSALTDCTSERSPDTMQPPIYGWSHEAVLKPTQTIQSFLVLHCQPLPSVRKAGSRQFRRTRRHHRIGFRVAAA